MLKSIVLPYLLLFILLVIPSTPTNNFSLQLASFQQANLQKHIFSANNLNIKYNDSTFNNALNCANGDLTIIEFNLGEAKQLQFHYEGVNHQFTSNDIKISVSPNPQPYPSLLSINDSTMYLKLNCANESTITNYNYFNKITIDMRSDESTYKFSFLLDCDENHRHKKFQYGYLFIALINAVIIVGVALHSRIWSIKINDKMLRVELKWIRFFLITFVTIVFGVGLYFFASDQFKIAFVTLKYIGVVFSTFFVFICFNQTLYLYFPLRKIIYSIFRWCDLISIISTIILLIISLFVENWILYNILAVCICVGSIKIFYFNSLKQAFLSMAISATSVTIMAIVMHYILVRSYNDYATQLSSPLVIQVPDLVQNLYKKCSWLPVLDVIVPGVCLAYLRKYDENNGSSWGGVYTVSGNISFIGSTILWVAIQFLYPFSVPFCLITYPLVGLSVFIIAWRRNDLKTLYYGTFYMNYEQDFNKKLLEEHRKSFSSLIPADLIDDIKEGNRDSSSNQPSFIKKNSNDSSLAKKSSLKSKIIE